MAIIVGSGEHRYEVIENWGKLPDGWHYGEVAAVVWTAKTASTSSTAASTR